MTTDELRVLAAAAAPLPLELAASRDDRDAFGLGMVVAVKDGVTVDGVGQEHHVRAGVTRWAAEAVEASTAAVQALFGVDGRRSADLVPATRSRSTRAAGREAWRL